MSMSTRDSGPAHSGTTHFWHQRITAILITPLTLWLIYGLASIPAWSLSAFKQWLSSPLSITALTLFILVGYYHAVLGLQVILEDYIASHGLRLTLWLSILLVSLVLGSASIFIVLKMALSPT
ncbi:MAG: succinate dehydrogenase, hydrophobic membrane anchor protein [Thiotrichales bacterium]